jgi:hypothetical protein
MAHRIDVALGASETMRNAGLRLVFIATRRGYQTGRVRPLAPCGLTRGHDCVALRFLILGGQSCGPTSLLPS